MSEPKTEVAGWCGEPPLNAPKPLKSADGRYAVYFHSSARMDEIQDESVDCVVTSPPYGIGISYAPGYKDGERAVSPDQVEGPVTSWAEYAAYLKRLEPIWRETYRKMKKGAFAVINLAPIHTKAALFGADSSMLPTVERTAMFWMDELGATYRWRYIWEARRTRNNSKGESQVFLGSYGLRDPETGKTYGLALRGQVLRMVEEILILQKGPLEISEEREARRRDKASRLSLAMWKDSFSQVQVFRGETGSEHPAVFPEELPRRMIRAYSVVGDLVLDPFLGSGTTMRVARELGRRCVGYEVEPGWRKLIADKTKTEFLDLTEWSG